MPENFSRDIAIIGVASSNVDVLSNNTEADFNDVVVGKVRVLEKFLLYGTAGNTIGRGIELYNEKDRLWFTNDYKETAVSNWNDKAEVVNIAFPPGARMKLYIESGATPASGRMKATFTDFQIGELR